MTREVFTATRTLGNAEYRIVKNPTTSDLLVMLRQSEENYVRAISTVNDIYIWKAYNATHIDAHEFLKTYLEIEEEMLNFVFKFDVKEKMTTMRARKIAHINAIKANPSFKRMVGRMDLDIKVSNVDDLT